MSNDAPGTPIGREAHDGAAPALPGGAIRVGSPWYGAPITVAWRRFWRGYVAFQGRASRSEYWWWRLVDAVVVVVLVIVAIAVALPAALASGGDGRVDVVPESTAVAVSVVWVLLALWRLATIVPDLAIGARRLHDTGRSGWWLLLLLVPVVSLALIVLLAMPSAGEGRGGPGASAGPGAHLR